MDYIEIYDALMKMNEAYKDIYFSKEYTFGRTFNRLKKCILTVNLAGCIKILNDYFAARKTRKKFSYIHNDDNFYPRINNDSELRNKKIVIYTCVIGNYDYVLPPIMNLNSNIHYVIFTNAIVVEGWEIYNIPENIKNMTPTWINRYIKMHAHNIFEDKYDYAIYIDGNVQMVGDPYSFVETAALSELGIAMYRHKERSCIFDEEKVCELYKKGSKNKMRMQIKRYREEGFPRKYGLLEATIIAINLDNVKGKELMEDWWKEFIICNSGRDQLSLPYVLWKKQYKIDDIGKLGNNILNDARLKISLHKD